MGLIVGICVYALLMILRIDFAFPLAIFAAVMDLVPTVGPLLGAGLAVLVTLATDPGKFHLGWSRLFYHSISGKQSDWSQNSGLANEDSSCVYNNTHCSRSVFCRNSGVYYRPSAHHDHPGYIQVLAG